MGERGRGTTYPAAGGAVAFFRVDCQSGCVIEARGAHVKGQGKDELYVVTAFGEYEAFCALEDA